jgi:hypothetical protein
VVAGLALDQPDHGNEGHLRPRETAVPPRRARARLRVAELGVGTAESAPRPRMGEGEAPDTWASSWTSVAKRPPGIPGSPAPLRSHSSETPYSSAKSASSSSLQGAWACSMRDTRYREIPTAFPASPDSRRHTVRAHLSL